MLIKNCRVVAFTNDVFEKEDKHYITVWVESEYDSGEMKLMEPEKAEKLCLVDWDNLPSPFFVPMQVLKDGGGFPDSAKNYHPFK